MSEIPGSSGVEGQPGEAIHVYWETSGAYPRCYVETGDEGIEVALRNAGVGGVQAYIAGFEFGENPQTNQTYNELTQHALKLIEGIGYVNSVVIEAKTRAELSGVLAVTTPTIKEIVQKSGEFGEVVEQVVTLTPQEAADRLPSLTPSKELDRSVILEVNARDALLSGDPDRSPTEHDRPTDAELSRLIFAHDASHVTPEVAPILGREDFSTLPGQAHELNPDTTDPGNDNNNEGPEDNPDSGSGGVTPPPPVPTPPLPGGGAAQAHEQQLGLERGDALPGASAPGARTLEGQSPEREPSDGNGDTARSDEPGASGSSSSSTERPQAQVVEHDPFSPAGQQAAIEAAVVRAQELALAARGIEAPGVEHVTPGEQTLDVVREAGDRESGTTREQDAPGKDVARIAGESTPADDKTKAVELALEQARGAATTNVVTAPGKAMEVAPERNAQVLDPLTPQQRAQELIVQSLEMPTPMRLPEPVEPAKQTKAKGLVNKARGLVGLAPGDQPSRPQLPPALAQEAQMRVDLANRLRDGGASRRLAESIARGMSPEVYDTLVQQHAQARGVEAARQGQQRTREELLALGRADAEQALTTAVRNYEDQKTRQAHQRAVSGERHVELTPEERKREQESLAKVAELLQASYPSKEERARAREREAQALELKAQQLALEAKTKGIELTIEDARQQVQEKDAADKALERSLNKGSQAKEIQPRGLERGL